tara:strand:- start:172 stop:297 length:126 start_codon:yes stop_codon:yes gene_type:complete
MEYIRKLIKKIRILYFEYKLRKNYKEDTYVYEDEEKFDLKK